MLHDDSDGDGNPQTQRESIAKHPKDEDVSQLTHLKNVLFLDGLFLWDASQNWDSERTKHDDPNRQPSESDCNADGNRDDRFEHGGILLQV
jgi:hypothetical protein